MKISVVLASYNGAEYITEQLQSIDGQSMRPDEIIIVDDASADNTIKLVEIFFYKTDIDCRLIEHKENKGYRETFFDALSYASGDVIFLCDQDDVWHEDKIERMLKVYEDNKAIKALNTSYELIDSEGNEISEGIRNKRRKKDIRNLYDISLEDVLSYNVAMGCTMAFTKEVKDILLEHINIIKTYNIPHDWIINIIAAALDGLYMLNEALISYRLHGDNTIGLNRAATIEKRINDYKEMAKQKKDMLKLLKVIDKDLFENEYEYMKLMVKSYHIRCEMLGNKKIAGYIKNYRKYNLKTVMDKKTMMYDLYLMIKKQA